MAHAGAPLRLPRGSEPNLAMILGGTEARLEDLVGAYAALQREGLAARPRLIANEPLRERRLLSPGAAWIVRQMISDTARPGTLEERIDTSRRANLAWKTGTSYGFRDAWAIGAAPGAIIGVWIGRPDGTPLPGQYGAITALPLLFAINDMLPRTLQAAASSAPASIGTATICWPLGQARGRASRTLRAGTPPGAGRHDSTDPARPDACGTRTCLLPSRPAQRPAPGDACSRPHADELASFAPWRTGPATAGRGRASPSPCRRGPGLRRHRRTRTGAADRRPGGRRGAAQSGNRQRAPEVTLRALGTGEAVQWLLDGRLVAHSRSGSTVQLRFDQAGPQRLVAIDAQGRYASIDLRVLDDGRERNATDTLRPVDRTRPTP